MKLRKEYTCPLEYVHDIIIEKFIIEDIHKEGVIVYTLIGGILIAIRCKRFVFGHQKSMYDWGIYQKKSVAYQSIPFDYVLPE